MPARSGPLGHAAAALALLAMVGTAGADDIVLELATWDHAVDTLEATLAAFEADNPDVRVELEVLPFADYHDTLVLRLHAGGGPDIVLTSQEWLPAWAEAGWLLPLDEDRPDWREDLAAIAPFARADLEHRGVLYGLPHHADVVLFVFDREVLAAETLPVPATWDELLEVALALQELGIAQPILLAHPPADPAFLDVVVAQLFGRGEAMFDEALEPIFDAEGSELRAQLQWLQDAHVVHDVIAFPQPGESLDAAMASGRHVFTFTYGHRLRALNEPAEAVAARFALAPMPGAAGGTLGFAKSYALTRNLRNDEVARTAALDLLDQLGGEASGHARRLAIADGLGSAWLGLLQDPEVVAAWAERIDLPALGVQLEAAHAGTWTAWTGIWGAQTRALFARAIAGEITVDEAVEAAAARWRDYRRLLAWD